MTMVPRVAVDRKRSPIAAGMSEPAVRVFPRTAMPVVKVTTISPVVVPNAASVVDGGLFTSLRRASLQFTSLRCNSFSLT